MQTSFLPRQGLFPEFERIYWRDQDPAVDTMASTSPVTSPCKDGGVSLVAENELVDDLGLLLPDVFSDDRIEDESTMLIARNADGGKSPPIRHAFAIEGSSTPNGDISFSAALAVAQVAPESDVPTDVLIQFEDTISTAGGATHVNNGSVDNVNFEKNYSSSTNGLRAESLDFDNVAKTNLESQNPDPPLISPDQISTSDLIEFVDEDEEDADTGEQEVENHEEVLLVEDSTGTTMRDEVAVPPFIESPSTYGANGGDSPAAQLPQDGGNECLIDPHKASEPDSDVMEVAHETDEYYQFPHVVLLWKEKRYPLFNIPQDDTPLSRLFDPNKSGPSPLESTLTSFFAEFKRHFQVKNDVILKIDSLDLEIGEDSTFAEELNLYRLYEYHICLFGEGSISPLLEVSLLERTFSLSERLADLEKQLEADYENSMSGDDEHVPSPIALYGENSQEDIGSTLDPAAQDPDAFPTPNPAYPVSDDSRPSPISMEATAAPVSPGVSDGKRLSEDLSYEGDVKRARH
ncbi:hypothetical protein DFS34DRAFT_609767 [Phlyctochytrium arcticum]|nr:hypothetical protein DFS34DRAFT_609767 [Phlyctochytrium arcticum]